MITNFIRIIKCLFGRHEYIPSIGTKYKLIRDAKRGSNKRSRYHWKEKSKIKYYYCVYCHKKISIKDYDKRRISEAGDKDAL